MAKRISKAERYDIICREKGLTLRECKVLSFERGEKAVSVGTFHYTLMWASVPIIIFDGIERGANIIVKINDDIIKAVRSIAKDCGLVEVTTNLA